MAVSTAFVADANATTSPTGRNGAAERCVVGRLEPAFDFLYNIYGQANITCAEQAVELSVVVWLTVNTYTDFDSTNSNDVIASYSIDALTNTVTCFPGDWVTHVWAYYRMADGAENSGEFVSLPMSTSC